MKLSIRIGINHLKKPLFEDMTVTTLLNEAVLHEATNHLYLRNLSSGKFTDMDFAIKDFAKQYYFYSEWFPRYMETVAARLTDEKHVKLILQNLSEEQGLLSENELSRLVALGIDPAWVDGIAHPELYRRFLNSIGIHTIEKPDTCVSEWREALLAYLQTASQAEIIGAIGLGTESVVKHIYPYIVKSINAYTSLKLEDYVFFPLHTEVDVTHGEIILQITEEIIQQDEQQAELVRKGMMTALNLRSKYWNAMKSRAVKKRSLSY